VPPAVAAALYDELALDIAVRRTLAGAAVTGDPFVPELTAAAAELPEPAVIAALDDLLRRDLLRSTAVPRRFRSGTRWSGGPSTSQRPAAHRRSTPGARAGPASPR
jgi:hypothetical protein